MVGRRVTEDDASGLEPEIVAFFAACHGKAALGSITREPLAASDSATQVALERVTIEAGGRRIGYVVKRIIRLGDWLARATDDVAIREHRLAQSGIFRLLPAGVASATLASVEIAGGAAIIMRDVSGGLMPPGDALIANDHVTVSLRGLARMHAAFSGFPPERAEALGLNRLESWLTPLSPRTARREQGRSPRDAVTPLIEPGWQAFSRLEPAAWEVIGPLLDDPRPLASALRRFTPTLVHGDAKAANFAVEADTLVLFDWSTTTAGPGALDLAWFLCINAHKLPCAKDAAIAVYRAERERTTTPLRDHESWDDELALAMMTSAMRLGWLRAYSAVHAGGERSQRDRHETAYWAAQALAARLLL